MGPLGEMPKCLGLTMDKFGAEFDGNRRRRIFVSKDASTDASAGFEHDDLAAGNAEVTRCGQAGRAGADDQDIRRLALESHFA